MKNVIVTDPSRILRGEWRVIKKCADNTWMLERMHEGKPFGEFGCIPDDLLMISLGLPANYGALKCECGSHSIGWDYHSDWCPKFLTQKKIVDKGNVEWLD